jgi:hypothetical protein
MNDRDLSIEHVELFETWRKLLGDSRCRMPRGQIQSPLGLITPIYCLNCGRCCGGVYGTVPTTAVLCDPCRERWGGLPGFEETPFTPDVPPED